MRHLLINLLPSIFTAVITIAFTVHIAYILKDEKRRQSQLDRKNIKHGKSVYELYGRVYTKKFLLASAIFSASWVLSVLSSIIEYGYGRDNIPALAMGLFSMACGFTGAIYGIQLLKPRSQDAKSKHSNSEDNDW